MSAPGTPFVEALRSVPWLTSLGTEELEVVAASARPRSFERGQALVGELELGEDVFILLEGKAEVSVSSGEGRKVLGSLGPGDACGEVALLTRQLRSASVTAVEPVVSLRLGRAELEALVERHPIIAVHFARELARRVAELDHVLDATLSGADADGAPEKLEGKAPAVLAPGGSLQRAWRELVLSHRGELPFLSLLAFTATLIGVRLGVDAVAAFGGSLFGVLRVAYVLGIVLILASTGTSLARFGRRVQRAVALTFGMGFALLLNELSVFLAFDSFYLDMTTPDPKLVFNVETLYRRGESAWAVTVMLAFLAQLTFLRAFYRRVAFVLRARWMGRGRGASKAQRPLS